MVDLNKRFVRITAIKDQYVGFDFAISKPEFFVELMLPLPMFDTFCENNDVEFLPHPKGVESAEYEQMMWRLGKVRDNAFSNL